MPLRRWSWATSSTALVGGYLLDRIFLDPPTRYHPVALFGNYASWLERHLYRPSRSAGALYVGAAVVPVAGTSYVVAKKWPMLALCGALYAALGGNTLIATAQKVAEALEQGRIAEARELIPWLCSRDPQFLDEPGIVRATIESVAENTSDAAVAPIFWSIVGVPGVLTHRAINTLDAMVGYKNDRYKEFGWAAAKADDAMAYLPARLTAAIQTSIAALVGRGKDAVHAWREDAPHHPSPNAGPVEATAAAALGVHLGGTTTYEYGTEERPVLGRGRTPISTDISRMNRLSRATQLVSAGIVLAGMQLIKHRRRTNY